MLEVDDGGFPLEAVDDEQPRWYARTGCVDWKLAAGQGIHVRVYRDDVHGEMIPEAQYFLREGDAHWTIIPNPRSRLRNYSHGISTRSKVRTDRFTLDYHEQAMVNVKAKLENRKKDVSEAKQKLSTIKRWKPSADREQALLATDSLINYVQTWNRDAMFRRSATTKRLSELFPGMAAALKFPASSRGYFSVDAFQDQYNRLEEKDVASLPLRSKVFIIPAKAIYLCVSKFDVTLREAP